MLDLGNDDLADIEATDRGSAAEHLRSAPNIFKCKLEPSNGN
jgi:hypothetical protein